MANAIPEGMCLIFFCRLGWLDSRKGLMTLRKEVTLNRSPNASMKEGARGGRWPVFRSRARLSLKKEKGE